MATLYGRNAGGNWSAAASWSTVSAKDASRVAAAAAPAAADTCILDDYSGNITVDTTSCVCKILNCTSNGNYAGTLTFTAAKILTMGSTGNIVLNAAMTLAGTGQLTVNGTFSLTSAGKTFPGALNLGTSGTKTLVDNWSITGALTTGGTDVVNKTGAGAGDTLTVAGGLNMFAPLSGNTVIVLTGGTWQHAGTTNYCSSNVNIAGAVTLSSRIDYKTGTFKFVSGSLNSNGTPFYLWGDATLDLNGIKLAWLVTQSDCYTVTLASNLSCGQIVCVPYSESDIRFAGNFSVTCDYFYFVSPAVSSNFILTAGQTLSVTTGIVFCAGAGIFGTCYPKMKSATATSAIYFNYSGAAAGCLIAGAQFTDVDASGSVRGIDNWCGQTLLRTTGITNRTSADIGGVSSNIFGII
jgi:hypothetical protein